MTEQLSLTGDSVVTADDGQRLGPAQQAVLDELQRFGRLDDDEAGAIVHERRGKHGRDARCQFCTADGRHVLASLRSHGLAREKRGDGWIDPKSLGPVRSAGESHSQGERSHRNPPGSTGPRARLTDPPTSHAAAESVGDLRESQLAVLLCFQTHGPMHDELLVERYQQTPRQSVSGLRTRRRELFDRGLLRATGTTAKTVSNRDSAIWELTAQGRVEAERHAGKAADPLDAIGF